MARISAVQTTVKRDFHVHTAYSDGIHRPREVVRIAARQGLQEMSITDHECCRGVPEGMEAASKIGIGFMTGIEISTSLITTGGAKRSPHILGFGFDLALARQDHEFNDYTEDLYEDMRRRCEEQCAASVKHPFQMTLGQAKTLSLSLKYDDFVAFVKGIGGSFHSGQFTNALLFKIREQVPGINISRQPDLSRALIWQHEEFLDALQRKNPGLSIAPNPGFKTLYREIKRKHVLNFIPTQDAVNTILRLGGVPGLAHPGEIGNGVDMGEIPEIIAMGIRGIEAFSPKHQPLDTCNAYVGIARENGLLVLGGTDFHGLSFDPSVQAGMLSNDVPIESDSIADILKRRP